MSKRSYKRWTNDEELVIISMRADGKSNKEIADALGRTYGAICQKVAQMIGECKIQKGRFPKVTVLEVAKIASEYCNNHSEGFRKLAEEKGVSYQYIHDLYYIKKKNKTRGKDIIKNNIVMFGKSGIITNGKNNNEEPQKSTLWHTIKGWLLSHLLS